MEIPLISVIVPVYNVEKYLPKCIESIINQTYKKLEIILVDDGSTDSSYEICKEYAAKDFRIIVLQKENGGLASARNKGLAYVHGEYIGFVDSDDWIESDTYEAMYCAATKKPDCIITCGRYNVDELTYDRSPMFELSEQQFWSKSKAIHNFLTWDNIDTSVCDKLFPAALISNLEFPDGLVSEDVMFTYTSLEKSSGVVHIGACKYNYLQRNGSITHSEFSSKSRGLTVYPTIVWESVYKNFPKLKEEADYYRFSRAIIYIKLSYLHGVKEKEESKALRKKIISILVNRYFPARQKFIAFSIAFCFFGILLKCYCALKNGRAN